MMLSQCVYDVNSNVTRIAKTWILRQMQLLLNSNMNTENLQIQSRKSYEKQYTDIKPLSRKWIYRIIKKFGETGSVFDRRKSNSGRQRTGRSEGNIEEVMAVIEETSKMSVRTVLSNITKKNNVSTIRRILKYDLKLKPYSCGSNKMGLRVMQPMLPWTGLMTHLCQIWLSWRQVSNGHHILRTSTHWTFSCGDTLSRVSIRPRLQVPTYSMPQYGRKCSWLIETCPVTIRMFQNGIQLDFQKIGGHIEQVI